MTWLNQPKSVQQAPTGIEEPNLSSLPQQQVPTPPQESNSKAATGSGTKLEGKRDFSPSSTLKPLPPNVELRSCIKEDIPHLKRLTSLLLPIPYPEKFYKEIIDDEITSDITLLAVWHDDPQARANEKGRLVGAIRCRLLSPNGAPMLYLSTLVLLSPFRSHGIATHLLQTVMRRAIDDYEVSSVGAHVWAANTEGLEWYRKRGFKEIRREPGYYRRLDPQDAVVMQRDVGVLDHLGGKT